MGQKLTSSDILRLGGVGQVEANARAWHGKGKRRLFAEGERFNWSQSTQMASEVLNKRI